MDSFTEQDRSRAIDTLRNTDAMNTRLETIERRQRIMAHRIRRLPVTTTQAIVGSLSKRAAIVLGIGIVLGSALGGAALELVRRLIASLLTVH